MQVSNLGIPPRSKPTAVMVSPSSNLFTFGPMPEEIGKATRRLMRNIIKDGTAACRDFIVNDAEEDQ